MLYLMTEKEYMDFPWFQRSLRSLYNESRKKHVGLETIRSAEQVPQSDDAAGVLLLGASEDWFRACIHEINRCGAHPISLVNRLSSMTDECFSSVSMDIRDNIRLAVDYLHSLGRRNLALYAVNPASTSDPGRAEIFRQLTRRDGHIYFIDNTLEHTFAGFRPRLEDYDGVICACDYAAISLTHNLLRIGVRPKDMPYIIGYGNMHLTRKSSPTITSISDDYEHFGRAALTIYNLVVREKSISSINVLLHSRLHIRETTGNEPFVPPGRGAVAMAEAAPNPFYHDSEIADMAKLEWLMNLCDETDLAIIENLMRRASYADIAERSFISETAAKYRIRKMQNTCGVSSRRELYDFLKRYI